MAYQSKNKVFNVDGPKKLHFTKINLSDVEDDFYMSSSEDEIEDIRDDHVLFADGKARGTSLILNDAFLLILHSIQIFAMVSAMALRWVWPEEWVRSSYYAFLVNLDVWEFMKVHGNSTYKSVQGRYVPSADMPFPYWYVLAGWFAVVSLIVLAYLAVIIFLRIEKHPWMMVRIAHLRRIFLVIAQIICLPLGTAIAKIFHCTDKGMVDPMNDLECLKGLHWAYISTALLVLISCYILFPVWMIHKTRTEMLNMTTDRHEGYLQLKETEYVQGFNILYVIGEYHIFSSFRKYGAYMRPTFFMTTLLLLLLYGGLIRYMFTQAILLTVLLSCMLLAFILIRPFRVPCFNYMLIITYLCLVLDTMMGTLLTATDPIQLSSVWLTPSYLVPILSFINVFWMVCCLVFILFLVFRHFGCLNKCFEDPLWPTLTSKGVGQLQPQTRKYIRAIISARAVLEQVLGMPALFAPAHETSRQIQIINAFCREAEHIRDPIHATMWDLLDELLDAHDKIVTKSLFAESVKDSIRQTANEFMKIMPMFVQRLAQREYDFILMSPLKRRMLLKMYCMGLFLNGRKIKLQKDKLVVPAVQKVYNNPKSMRTYRADGNYEEIYPEIEPGPDYRPITAISLDAMSQASLDDEIFVNEADQWTKQHPIPEQGEDNEAFVEDDASTTVKDNNQDNDSEIVGNLIDLTEPKLEKDYNEVELARDQFDDQDISGSISSTSPDHYKDYPIAPTKDDGYQKNEGEETVVRIKPQTRQNEDNTEDRNLTPGIVEIEKEETDL